MKSIGIEPDGFVGHSIGELVCAYTDGSFTAEQTILISLLRAQSIIESKLTVGAMAVIGNFFFSLSFICLLIINIVTWE